VVVGADEGDDAVVVDAMVLCKLGDEESIIGGAGGEGGGDLINN